MATVPQLHPLWLAEAREREIHAGRVIAWQVAEAQVAETGIAPGGPTATPIVAFTNADGLLLETGAPHGPLVYLEDTRHEAIAAASRAARPGPGPGGPPYQPGHPPPGEDEEDDGRPPDPRTRVLTLRRLTPDELPGDESATPASRIHRHDT
jgi:hypothetical protein